MFLIASKLIRNITVLFITSLKLLDTLIVVHHKKEFLMP